MKTLAQNVQTVDDQQLDDDQSGRVNSMSHPLESSADGSSCRIPQERLQHGSRGDKEWSRATASPVRQPGLNQNKN